MNYTEDLCTGGAVTAISQWSTKYIPAYAVDNVLGYNYGCWLSATSGNNGDVKWWQYAFATARCIRKLRLNGTVMWMPATSIALKVSTTGAFSGEETTLIPTQTIDISSGWVEFEFSNSITARYYRIYCSRADYNACGITEVEMMEALNNSYLPQMIVIQ